MKIVKKRERKPKNISEQIKSIMITYIIVALLVISTVSSACSFVNTVSSVNETMISVAHETADSVKEQIMNSLLQVEMIGMIPELGSEELTKDQKQEILDRYAKFYGWNSSTLLDVNGISFVDSETDLSGRDYFQKAIKGEANCGDPVLIPSQDLYVIMYAAPLWKDGIPNTEIVGVVLATKDAKVFSEAMSHIKPSKNGGAYMINTQGNTIASYDLEAVLNQKNTIEAVKTNSKLESLAGLEQKMIEGKTGTGYYIYGGNTKVMAYIPVGINGWALAIEAPITDFLFGVMASLVLTVITLIIATIVCRRAALRLGNRIGQPIALFSDRLKLLAKGDLHSEVPTINTEDETKVLEEATVNIVQSQKLIIGDLAYVLEEMANGNFRVESNIGYEAYVGQYTTLIESAKNLSHQLSDTLLHINETAEQVNSSASQMEASAQALAEGATEQAGAIEEVSATVEDVTSISEKSAKDAMEAANTTKQSADNARSTGHEMEELTSAMMRITETSKEIESIIGAIEDIASQTNLLSLNASIEAARAGEAGRGFAVVAGHIGKLASDSSNSAVMTRNLIAKALEEIENGNEIVKRATVVINTALGEMEQISSKAMEVATSSKSQVDVLGQVGLGMEQIVSVVQTNSATAQEASAISEQLATQADYLKEMIGKFQFRV